MRGYVLAAGVAGALAGWIVLTFVVAVPSGWVHLLLALATILIAVGIVKQPPRDRSSVSP